MRSLHKGRVMSAFIDETLKSHGCLTKNIKIDDSIPLEEYLKRRRPWNPAGRLRNVPEPPCNGSSFPFCSSMDVKTANRYAPQYLALHECTKFSNSGAIYESIANCAILVIGAGGLGSPVLMYLASAGVGIIGIMDGDVVEISNLHRQIIHDECNVGMNKACSARERLLKMNSSGRYISYEFYLGEREAKEIIPLYDIIVDASDNPQTKYLINDACVLYDKSCIIASCIRAQGQLMVYNRIKYPTSHEKGVDKMMDAPKNEEKTPCFRCICPFEGNPLLTLVKNACSAAGVIGSIPGVLGTLQATEALKLAAGITDASLLGGRLLTYDSANILNPFRCVKLARNPSCVVCGDSAPPIQLKMYESQESTSNLDRDYLAVSPEEFWDLYMDEIENGCPVHTRVLIKSDIMEKVPNGREYDILLLDVRPSAHFTICHLPGAISWPLQDILNYTHSLEPSPYVKNKSSCDKGPEYTTQNSVEFLKTLLKTNPDRNIIILVICRRGNASRVAAEELRRVFGPNESIHCYSVAGGHHYLNTHFKLQIPAT
ncbi:conserved hypothetical protein [Theileria equi strain WA]|uniref:Rhodanese domain-containing protein n=1 Tax=Theileria equi strain WA TaxID=1537102 RepID=L1LFY9_THEEQ|nr:conserved hypothetical protein [Theileria equi strain WA]EKX74189.1 conserved hypothetical protein [Theileria equi strain WA]|eukprot:XP_004833641.1 conserved hypothetical protein [Theileria equi strain WA]